MKITIEEQEVREYGLHTAILLYGSGHDTLAVTHPVVSNRKGTRLGAGTFVTQSVIERLLDTCNRTPLTYVPPNVVGLAHNAIAWYEPAATRTMFFKPSSDTAVGAFDGKRIPQPPLVFIAGGRNLRVYALATDERPNGATPLYLAPYWNIFDRGGSVCLGSMEIPNSVAPADSNAWSEAFFASNFTHLSSGKRWRHPGTYAEMLQDTIDLGSFNPNWLIAADITLERAICGH